VKRGFQTILAVAALAAAVLLWKWAFPSDETRIRKLLAGLADTASLPAGEGTIGRARRIDRLTSALTPEISIRFAPPNENVIALSGRDSVQQAAMAAIGAAKSLKVDFIDIKVDSIDSAGGVADAVLTAKIQAGADRDFGIQPLKIALRKDKDFGWRIHRIESFRALNAE
jgi:hypothetical protein